VFSGLIEACVPVLRAEVPSGADQAHLLRLTLARPQEFSDVAAGDSVACDGVCLTVESFTDTSLQFALAHETLQVTGWTAASLKGLRMNLERSLRAGDRNHGHWVTGHVDSRATVLDVRDASGVRWLKIQVPSSLRSMVWPKGSWAVNGVSLTINSVEGSGQAQALEHCLIPETLARTNLAQLRVGDTVNVEVDQLARAWTALATQGLEHRIEQLVEERVAAKFAAEFSRMISHPANSERGKV
jgi:riboflavin synthase